ncbi:paratose synthase [Treponema primitia ZAS-2]|uniref:Paratose synthase n=1 Tax=Treponema primitia (strain ATCC BAA-887 / DSM 12427 / ZAS-2) TaxID=545694 RepID=F5YHK2_TREPZ|nr:NAD-dependent epimerase/dehydratase family protein [Treponema primitia]AEF86358.1 paratose synthase [Treponema primitia ZAS-2]
MKILITGATGFIGSHLIVSLLENKNVIAILKRDKTDLKNLTRYLNKIQIYQLNKDNTINSAMKIFSPDIVIHLATLYINNHRDEDIDDLITSNISFGTHVLEAMKNNNIKYILNIGTRWQHIGNKPYFPANLYAATKEAFKDILIYYESQGIQSKTIELCDTYGNEDTRKKVMDLLITACQKKEILELTQGEQILDLAYVRDITTFISTNIVSHVFFDNKTISLSGTIIKLRDLGAIIEKKYDGVGILKWGFKPYRINEVMNPPLYYKKIVLNQNSLQEYLNRL